MDAGATRSTCASGKPGGPWHCHFVLAVPGHYEMELFRLVSMTWQEFWGNANVRLYDREQSGAFYLSKTAKSDDFEFEIGTLGRMQPEWPFDLWLAQQDQEFVPMNVRKDISSQTLRIRTRKK